MSDDNEQKSGSGLAKGVGVIGAGAGVGYAMDKAESRGFIKQALSGDEKAPKKIAEKVSGALEKDAVLAKQSSTLKTMAKATEGGKIPTTESITFKGAPGKFEMHTKMPGGSSHTLTGVKSLPKGAVLNTPITDAGQMKGILEKGTKSQVFVESEKNLVAGVRKTGGIKIGSGLSATNGMGKAKIIGVTVAAAVAGGYVVNRLFGGQHTNRVQAERQVQQDLGRA